MKTKIKAGDHCEYHIEVDIPSETVSKAFDEVYKEIKKYAKIPGFRVGNAPQDLLERYHGKDAEEEVLKRLIPDGYQYALKEKKLQPIGLPDISDVVMAKGANLTFKARVEVRPEINLQSYKGIAVKKKKSEIT
ncbi:MAG: trigger factor family protein, partial [Candidatus Omnitrophica bacterium]|nr:trigger factor family protein [Candidatus Omnitrophota bacterium]